MDDERFMARAIDLARRAVVTSPNPRVGALLVRSGEILAEAWHEAAGTPHAEARVLEEADAAGATLYVTLEPCVHHGRTPPCVPAIVAAWPARIVVGLVDPDPRVGGRGIDALREAGIDVDVGVLEPEVRVLNAPYVHHRTTGRPWVTLKLALGLDGRMAAPDRSSRWITGPDTRRRVHRRRAAADALLIGAGTALADRARLTVRDAPSDRRPLRVVVDAAGRLPVDLPLFSPEAPTLIATTNRCPHETQTAWKEAGAEVVVVDEDDGKVDLAALLQLVGARDVVELYCEGGAELATSLLRADLVERLEIHRGPVVLGAGGPEIGDLGITTIGEAPRWRLVEVERVGDDVVTTYERTA